MSTRKETQELRIILQSVNSIAEVITSRHRLAQILMNRKQFRSTATYFIVTMNIEIKKAVKPR